MERKAVVLVSAKRTAIGNFGGSLAAKTAVDLGEIVARSALESCGISPEEVDLLVMGIARQAGCGPNPARQVACRIGVPVEKPSYTVNMACASSLQSIMNGYRAIQLGEANVALCGGMESMSQVPYMLDKARFDGYRLGHGVLIDGNYRDGFLDPISGLLMGETAENLVDRYHIPREEQDLFALESHQKAIRAIDSGFFKDEIVAVTIERRKQPPSIFDTDEHPRRDTNLEKLGRLKTVFRENGTVTAGNSSGLTDAASAVVLTTLEYAEKHGLEPFALLEDYIVTGVPPEIMGIGPVPATRLLLEKLNRSLHDYDLIECNEAFAAQVLAVERELKWDRERLNIHGGAIALGHPIGATGARIVTTLMHAMKRYSARLGLVTLCVSGGFGVAMSFRRLDG